MEVKSVFLNTLIEKEVFVKEPPGFESSKYSNHAFKFHEALYGLKQALRTWYARLKTIILKKKKFWNGIGD